MASITNRPPLASPQRHTPQQGALAFASPDAERVYVGKRGGRPSIEQPSISALLVAHVAAGKRVARLKGGCPSVFSRVHQELAALRAAGCAWELVPGVSSALAAPLAAGFPLTDAQLSPAFAVVSGHDPAAVDWAAFDRIPTLVLLMAGSTLPAVAAALLARGRAADTPVCVVRSAGTPEQAILRWTLGSVAAELGRSAGSPAGASGGETAARTSLSPCVVIIGRVAGQDALSAAAAAAAAGGGEGG